VNDRNTGSNESAQPGAGAEDFFFSHSIFSLVFHLPFFCHTTSGGQSVGALGKPIRTSGVEEREKRARALLMFGFFTASPLQTAQKPPLSVRVVSSNVQTKSI